MKAGSAFLHLISLFPIIKAVVGSGNIQLNLISFTDMGMKMKLNGATWTCTQSGPKSRQNPCYFLYEAYLFDSKGNLVINQRTIQPQVVTNISVSTVKISDSNFQNLTGSFSEPLAALVVTVTHSGDLYDSNNQPYDCTPSANPLSRCVYLVDQYTLNLSSEYPDGKAVHQTLPGSVLQSSLELNYTISCNSGKLGENCQFNSNQCSIKSTTALCNATTLSYICTAVNTQLKNCTECPINAVQLVNETSYACLHPDKTIIQDISTSSNDAYLIVMIIFIVIAILEFILMVAFIIYMSCTGRHLFHSNKTQPLPARSTEESHFSTKPQIRTNPNSMPNGRVTTGGPQMGNDEWNPSYTTTTATRSAPPPPRGFVSFNPKGSSEDLVVTKRNHPNGRSSEADDSKSPNYAESVSSQSSHPSRREVSV